MKVHRALGPGLLEKTYQRCLAHQLKADGLDVEVEVPIDIDYDDLRLPAAYFADLIVDRKVLVELKAIDQLHPIHSMQTLTYLKLARLPVGLLINFNVSRLTEGLRRFANTKTSPPSAEAAEAAENAELRRVMPCSDAPPG